MLIFLEFLKSRKKILKITIPTILNILYLCASIIQKCTRSFIVPIHRDDNGTED
jgi:hypothetical protein